MSHTRRRSSAAFGGILALAVLTGCTNGKLNSNPVFEYGLEVVGLGAEEEPAPEGTTTSIGPPLLVGYNAIRVAIPSVGVRGQSRYFVASDGVEIAMNKGLVTRVIGLGVDLEGMYLPADSPYTKGIVQAARDNAVTDRIADYYVGGEILHDSFRCALTYVPRENGKGIVNEQCRRFFGGSGFRNTYWTEGDKVVCSLQWFHPDADMLQFFETPEQSQSIDLRKEGC